MMTLKMRYLNKVIFINSAHVPYAEVCLDGNVHFIGTQGVGKSTLLRSILFFYNADKSRLGIRIQDKQQGYDDFYLPYTNSYIIYEVVRENGKFFIVTFRSQGRTAFRIVDCEYNRNYFIDESGMAHEEWGKISEAIGANVYKSHIIRRYEEFRDIIYGNRKNVDIKLRRFCIMESDRYQNIVRAITNIFLNQSLESRVIKDTIIDSLDFSNDNVDLSAYKKCINEFRDRFDDIWKWYKKERNGTVKVHVDAEHVIFEHQKYEALCLEIDELCGQLIYAINRDERLLPEMKEKENGLSEKLSRQKRFLSEVSEKYNAERDKLNQREGVLKDFLSSLDKKAQYYKNLDIVSIASRIERESELKIQKNSIEKQFNILTSRNTNVKNKYSSLKENVEVKLKESLNEIDRRFIDSMSQLSDERNRLTESQNANIANIKTRYEEIKNDIQNEIRISENKRNKLRVNLIQSQNANPFEDEIAEINRKISDSNAREKDLVKKLGQTQSEINELKHNAEIVEKDLSTKCEKDVNEINNKIETINAEIDRTKELIKNYNGSLIEWLYKNEPNWEENIGLLLDEKSVLYNTNLNPRKVDDSRSVLGIHIDLSNIDREIRSPRELQTNIEFLERQKQELQNRILGFRENLSNDIEEALAKHKKQLRSLRKEELTVNSELNSIPLRIDRLNTDLTKIKDKLQTWRKNRQEEIISARDRVEKELEGLHSRMEQAEILFKKEKKTYDDKFIKRKNEIEKKINLLKIQSENDKEQKSKASNQEIREITARMDAELKGAGVDTKQLNELRSQLYKISEELTFIEHHRQDYFGWLNDKKEYFEPEEEKRSALKEVRKKIGELTAKYELRKQNIEEELHHIESELKTLTDTQTSIETTIAKVRSFMSSESKPQNLDSAKPDETIKPLSDIFESLCSRVMNHQRREEAFRKSVNNFKSNFSSANTLGFEFNITSIPEYRNFAIKLNEFISNNKIEIVRTRTNELYADIILSIGHEVGDLIQHGADIRKTINDINSDFRENNFVGVIKEIELRAVESNDRIMQQLLHIKDFSDNNGQILGELNLFSDSDNRDNNNDRATKMLMTLADLLDAESTREKVTLSDTFKLEFKVRQNDQDTNWVEKLTNVGSDGTDILVKAIVNIMLINVFKRKASARFGDFFLHCMMDEIGKLHPNNVHGILAFANARNIRLINSSPTTYNASAYRYTYVLSKDTNSNTVVKSLLSIR